VRLALALTGAHGLAAALCLALPLAAELRTALVLLVVLGLADAMRTHVLYRGPSAVREAQWRGGTEWWVRGADGAVEVATLHHSSLVLPWLVVLRLSVGRLRRRTLVLPADALSPDAHRRLRVLLLRRGSGAQARGT
jgi:toxin CptA